MADRCSWCGQPGTELTACEGDRLCRRCVDRYLDAAIEPHRVREYSPIWVVDGDKRWGIRPGRRAAS